MTKQHTSVGSVGRVSFPTVLEDRIEGLEDLEVRAAPGVEDVVKYVLVILEDVPEVAPAVCVELSEDESDELGEVLFE